MLGEILLGFGPMPVLGKRGLPVFGKPGELALDMPATDTGSEYVPTAQLSVAATRTHTDWFAGRLPIVVEKPETRVV